MIRTHLDKDEVRRIEYRLRRLYGEEVDVPALMERFYAMMGRYGVGIHQLEESAPWDENDTVLITYADSILEEGEVPLVTLRRFLCERMKGSIRVVHILPFFPWSSDDGFSVIDYREVDLRYGDWSDVGMLRTEFSVMYDLVVNHCSRQSRWFKDFVTGVEPGRNFFHVVDPATDLSEVVRPRSTPLLSRTATRNGESHVWCTFSSDQIDLNFSNPDVLFEFLDILFFYVYKGVRIIRLDAIAFLWKEIGTNCLHLPQTHEVVKLFRDVLRIVAPNVILLTETNVPHAENISYFGDGDEAHMVYNFSLPPLLLHAVLRGDTTHLTNWARSLPNLPPGQTFFNFTASHDGIGVRPLQGILADQELDWIVEQMKERGGLVGMRAMPDGSQRPYELNITYVDAMSLPGNEQASISRFLCSQAVMLAMRGMPAVYIHSMLGTPNYLEGVAQTKHNRTINRRKWDLETLQANLNDHHSKQAIIFERYSQMLRRRQNHPAFHPDGPMTVIDLGTSLFGFLRTSPRGEEQIACVFNLTNKEQKVNLALLHPKLGQEGDCRDILNAVNVKTAPGRSCVLKPYQARWVVVSPE